MDKSESIVISTGKRKRLTLSFSVVNQTSFPIGGFFETAKPWGWACILIASIACSAE
jgi:hypothetical protein